jgi:hypothetical protein
MRKALRWIVIVLLVVVVLGSLAIPGRLSLAVKILAPIVAVIILWWIYRDEKIEDKD